MTMDEYDCSSQTSMNMDDFLGNMYMEREAMTLEAYLENVSEEHVKENYEMMNNRGRGRKRRAVVVEAVPLDKATQQKQRRMIKNRESAARSRDRKQAYTAELEALVTKLEQQNATLLNQQAELKKQRLKQLIEGVKPVVEKTRPLKAVLQRSSSMSW